MAYKERSVVITESLVDGVVVIAEDEDDNAIMVDDVAADFFVMVVG